MKVDVVQVESAKFRSRFRWWSQWIDVAVFDYSSTPFLLQMRVSRSNKKQFISTRITGKFIYRQATSLSIGDLMPMKSNNNNQPEKQK